jgi:hypothetical protein
MDYSQRQRFPGFVSAAGFFQVCLGLVAYDMTGMLHVRIGMPTKMTVVELVQRV